VDCLTSDCAPERTFAVAELASFYGPQRTVGEVLLAAPDHIPLIERVRPARTAANDRAIRARGGRAGTGGALAHRRRPAAVLVLTDVPLDMPVEELTTDAAEWPSFEDRQIAGRRHRLRVRGTPT
jgi:hypothetical protein